MSATIGELCAGYGGLGMGVARVIDAEVAWYSEIDKGALKVLEHRFPGVPNIGDMTTADWSSVPPVDILTGGFPCQPVSHAGKRRGDEDERWLWDDVARAVGELGPKLLVLENVRGLLTAGDGRLFGRVLGALAELGYDAQWLGLRAARVGAPHGRWRVFIAAHPKGHPWRLQHRDGEAAADAGRLRGGARRESAPGQADSGRTLALSGIGGRVGADAALMPTPRATDGTKGGPNQRGSSGDLMLPSAVQRLLPTPAVTQWGDYEAAIRRWEQVLGRPAITPTMTSSKGTPQLSPAFSEWMMGLPAGWVTDAPGITRNEALRALGNGVVPQQAEAALRFLLPVLSEVAA